MHIQTHLRNAEWMVELLENRFQIFGKRFGLDPLLGLIPWVGDAVAFLLSLYVVWIATQFQVPDGIQRKMWLNILLDLVIGAVPIVGDVGDFFFRSNTRNFHLLKQYLTTKENDVELGEIVR